MLSEIFMICEGSVVHYVLLMVCIANPIQTTHQAHNIMAVLSFEFWIWEI